MYRWSSDVLQRPFQRMWVYGNAHRSSPPLRLDQIIVGGESGHGGVPMTLRGRGHCAISAIGGVAFFCKQMGSVYGEHKAKIYRPI